MPKQALSRDGNGKGNGEGRLAKRRRATRAKLLEAAYEVIAESGVADAKIKDITDRADVGFGTFYNYFADKDALASQVLDCVINDYGRRNVIATQGLRRKEPALVMPVSMRLVMREAAQTPMWQWWALRPDLLVDRMRDGFGPFGKRDMRDAIERGIFHLRPEDVDSAWALAAWMMVGGIHDIVVGDRPLESDMFVIESIMRMMGLDLERAQQVSSSKLPAYSKTEIDWTFELPSDAASLPASGV
jgi:AcrR family transcriptional regulator